MDQEYIHKALEAYLRKTNIQPIIPLLKCGPDINNLNTQLLTQLYTSFWIYSAWFICSTEHIKSSTKENHLH